MSYVEENLIQGETVEHRGRLHWKVGIGPVLLALLLVALAVTLFWRQDLAIAGQRSLNHIVGGILLLAAAGTLVKAWIVRISAEFAVTNKRVILKTGFIRNKTAEMFLAKIESVSVDQTVIGRLLGYGSIVIRGTGGSLEPFNDIAQPLEFRRQIQEQIGRALEQRS